VTVTIIATPGAPTASSPQTFCTGNSPKVANLTTTSGTGILWYAAQSGGSALLTTDALVDGATYYASQTNGCESSARVGVNVIINTTPVAPSATAVQYFCTNNNPTIANLVASGSSITWYNAPTAGSSYLSTAALTNATSYWASQTVNICGSSARVQVTATVIAAPTVSNPTVTPNSLCGPGNVVFSATPSAGSINWYDSQYQGSIIAPPTTVTTTTTLYAAAIVNGCTSTARTPVKVTVNPLPNDADFITGTPVLCAGTSGVAYSAPVSAGSWSYNGTGHTIHGTGASITIDFSITATSGVLSLTGTSTCGNQQVIKNYAISVIPIPVVGNVSGPATVCPGTNNVFYSIPFTNTTSSTWNYSNATVTIAGTQSTRYLNFAANAQSGNLTIYGNNVCGNSVAPGSLNIAVNPTPITVVSPSPSSFICGSGQVVFFATTSVPGGIVKWYDAPTGGNLITVLDPTISVTTTYYAEAVAPNGVACARTKVTAEVRPAPTITLANVSPSVICSSGSVVFSATASAGSVNWYSVSTGGSPITPPTSISNTTTLYAEAYNNGCASVRTGVTATVISGSASVNALVTPTTLCGPGTVLFSATTPSGTIKWYSVLSGGNPVTPPTSISSSVTLYAEADNNGCVSTRSAATATVYTKPAGAGTITGPAVLCAGANNVQYTVPTIANASSYTWTFNGTGATINGTSNPVTINFAGTATSGVLTVKGNSSTCSGAVSANYAISVKPLPIVGTISGLSSVSPNTSNVLYSTILTNAISYNWIYSGTGVTINGTGGASRYLNFSSLATNGDLTITGTNTCGSASGVKSITVATPIILKSSQVVDLMQLKRIDDNSLTNEPVIYSFEKEIMISKSTSGQAKVMIYDLQGRMIKNAEMNDNFAKFNIQKTGVYLVKMVSDKGTFIKQVYIE
jgi:hypothetical protein